MGKKESDTEEESRMMMARQKEWVERKVEKRRGGKLNVVAQRAEQRVERERKHSISK